MLEEGGAETFVFFFQDKDKGLRIHLNDTVEELRKFNARRKLKSAVKSAVDSTKWYHFDDPNADAYSDNGDDEVSCAGEYRLDMFE